VGKSETADGRRARGTLEQEVMAALAASDVAMTPAEVRAAVGKRLAYTTIMTVLARLHDKGLVSRQKSGRAFAYRALGEGADLTARQMRRLLDSGNDRVAVLSRFVDVLTAADEALLAGLLRRDETDGTP
jgi:predicted transcriptional regulator